MYLTICMYMVMLMKLELRIAIHGGIGQGICQRVPGKQATSPWVKVGPARQRQEERT